MIKLYCVPALSSALEQLKKLIKDNRGSGRRTVIFCEDRLTLAAERAVCAAVGGTFDTAVYTFSRFLASNLKDGSQRNKILSGQGSAMVVRKLIEKNRERLKCFKRLSSPQAAQTVYDTIALLYSSRVTAGDAANVETNDALLKRKLEDIALLYGEYFDYLEENGLEDRNSYLRRLPEIIKTSSQIMGADVVLLGFQCFTCSTAECASACMETAENVYGIFTGGAEDIYVNEALAGFAGCAEKYGGAVNVSAEHEALPEADRLRRALFNGDAFRENDAMRTPRVHLFEAADGDEELEYIAACIKKHVSEGERYRNISLMLPNADECRPLIKRVFSQYRIPYYVDSSSPLSSHFICEFICSYLSCAADGCLPESAASVISSPLFTASRKQKDNYRNYILRACNFRGGVKRQPNEELCQKSGYDYAEICAVRSLFLDGLEKLPQKADGKKMGESVMALLDFFNAEQTLSALSKKFSSSLEYEAALCERAYGEAAAVISEAGNITAGESVTCAEFLKLLKSGFAADKVSIIPPKQDAVFVGDVARTANTGSNVIFAARLTGDVPAAGDDSALLTDRELTSLEHLNVFISPKISLVNMRARETVALNLCAFNEHLYLSYPSRLDGAECSPSEIISYAKAVFVTPGGNKLSALTQRRLDDSGRALAYYCSERAPALKQLVKLGAGGAASSVYKLLAENGYEDDARRALENPCKSDISAGEKLFTTNGSISPTALETYFSCPYLGFMRSGLRVAEREEGTMNHLDSGNFIHAVLQNCAPKVESAADEESMGKIAVQEAESLLNVAPYSSIKGEKSGGYAAAELVEEAKQTCLGMYRQLRDSSFSVAACEQSCEMPLGRVKLYGRIDRVDANGDMVRVIDYKTGKVNAEPEKYYMGLKLQLQLYLSAAAKGRRAVGAYYFPASVEYKNADSKTKDDGDFRLKGFMDGGEDVVSASDRTLEQGQKSRYFDAALGGKPNNYAMDSGAFASFLDYGVMVAKNGADEMTSGYIKPSPVKDICKYCKMGGCCGFSRSGGGTVREGASLSSADIAQIAANRKEV